MNSIKRLATLLVGSESLMEESLGCRASVCVSASAALEAELKIAELESESGKKREREKERKISAH